MKETGFNLICKLWCTILLCAGILTGCALLSGETEVMTDTDDDGIIDGTTPSAPSSPSNPSNPSTPSIRPYKIDMAEVQGFAIVENTSNAPRTKADKNGDGVDDDMPNDNGSDMGSESVNTSPYALYTIDENGELHVSIFYFEVVQSEGDSTDTSYTEVLKEVSNALQIVPSLVTDLGNYILFSYCQCQISESDISDEARAICKRFIEDSNIEEMLIRKSDGALFDLSGQNIFSYESYGKGKNVTYNIPEYSYIISSKGNIFSRIGRVSKIEDNGDAITVSQITQYDNYFYANKVRNFAIDNDENIYDIFGYYADCGRRNSQIEIYYNGGGFNVYDILPTWILPSWNNVSPFDVITEKSGITYIFLQYDGAIKEGEYTNPGTGFISTSITNGIVKTEGESFFNIYYDYPRGENGYYSKANYQYLGNYDNCISWYCIAIADQFNDNQPVTVILSYNTDTQEWSLEERDIQINPTDYDVFARGKKCYGATIEDKIINVTEFDIASETSRSYTLPLDIPTIVAPNYSVTIVHDVPYLRIDGRNTINGADASITINLITGENNTSFESDNRTVLYFYRIN